MITGAVMFVPGESKTGLVSVEGAKRSLSLVIPACWETADIAFEVKGDTDFVPVYDKNGSAVAVKATAGTAVDISDLVDVLRPWQWVRIVSGTHDVPVAQHGTQATTVIDFGSDKTLSINSGIYGVSGNAYFVVVNVSDTDDLSVTEDVELPLITINLANTTASKNSAEAIQAAIRATTFEAAVVTASAEYEAAPPITCEGITAQFDNGTFCVIDIFGA